jgi:hypothetical protein
MVEIADLDWREPVVISCSKQGNSPVLAYPEVSEGTGSGVVAARFLRPAGGLYPHSLDATSPEQILDLSWEDGFLAVVMSRLQTFGLEISLVNSAALRDRLRALQDPWNMDLGIAAEALAGGRFTAYDLDALPSREVRLDPGPGNWFLESPFSPVWRVRDGQTLLLSEVSLGMHALFNQHGRAIRLSVGERETVILELER